MKRKHRFKKKSFKFHGVKPSKKEIVEGEMQLRGRFGFVLSEVPGTPDVYVTGPSLSQAMHGDRVQVRIIPGRRREGVILKVVKRARSTAVGILRMHDGLPVIIPDDESLSPVRVFNFKADRVKEGQAVVVRITKWPHKEQFAGGEIIEVLGAPDSLGVDLRMILRREELSDAFPQDVLQEADSTPKEVLAEHWQGRKTFFHLPVFTIDGPDAKDFDDAISLETLPSGNVLLGVHIADVSEYVKIGSKLDTEAAERATSIYPPGSVVPMLPPALSENICSLRPNVERLTMSCIMEIDPRGEVKKCEIVNGVIKSARRFTYGAAQDVLDKKNERDPVEQTLIEMSRLSRLLRKIRFKRGAIDFDMPETKVVLNERGRPVDIVVVDRLKSHKLIEEFMILANEAVARHVLDHQRKGIYRVHGKPDKEKLKKASETFSVYDVAVPRGFTDGVEHALSEALRNLNGKPFKNVLSRLILRTLKQAVYSVKHEGHYGLASTAYTHFTSPIRRYPDLCIHRILKDMIRSEDNRQFKVWEGTLHQIALHSSKRERQAQSAESEYTKLKKVQFMKDKEGDVFKGIISSVVSFGFFVELIDYQVEGLVHMEGLEDDYYIFDEKRLSLVGRRTHRKFRTGQTVTVQLAHANVAKRQLDFQLIRS